MAAHIAKPEIAQQLKAPNNLGRHSAERLCAAGKRGPKRDAPTVSLVCFVGAHPYRALMSKHAFASKLFEISSTTMVCGVWFWRASIITLLSVRESDHDATGCKCIASA